MMKSHFFLKTNSFYRVIIACALVLITKSISCNCYHFRSIPFRNDQQYYSMRQRQIKNEIIEALQHLADNETLEGLIPKMFNLTNPNPTYIFILPSSRKHKRLIMRKSDFEKATFPEVSKIYIRLSRLHRDQPSSLLKSSVSIKKLNEKLHLHNHEDDGVFVNRITENVQTERNFIDYVQKLNRKMASLKKTVHTFDLIESESSKTSVYTPIPGPSKTATTPKGKHQANKEWSRLGLDGWRGEFVTDTGLEDRPGDRFVGESPNVEQQNSSYPLITLSPPVQKFEKYTHTVPPAKSEGLASPLQYNFLDEPEDNNIWDLPGKVSSSSDHFDIENKTLAEMSEVLDNYNNPKWPIAYSRDSHKDDDVFIARANDPFGYSTKYKLRNSTSRNGREGGEPRRKRAIVELYSMLKCATGCDPLIYKGYGCYCGFLGSGKPTDGIDKCCQQHDRCYDNSGCHAFQQYFVPYIWKCYQGQPVCATDHGEWGGPGSCASQLCKCDLALSKCLRKFYCPRRRSVCGTSKFRMLQNYLLIF